ncbi:lysophospholipid acyltransferase family protein [bacterium]|nr:lysophospholipid acyltransferase family protein [bacterium]
MMSRNKYYNLVLQKWVNFLVGIFYHVAPHLPRSFMGWTGAALVTPLYYLWPKYIRAMHQNYRVILGQDISKRELDRTSRQTLRNFARYFVDLFYFRGKSHDAIRSFLGDVSGVPEFEAALGLGRGAVLLTAHLGNWELGGYFLGQKQLPINVVYYQDRFKQLELLRSLTRKDMAVKEIGIGSGPLAGLPIIRALKRNEIVAMQGDRDFRGDGLNVTFFGRQVRFPVGPVICAMIANAPIIPVFILRNPDNTYNIIAQPPLFVEGDSKDRPAVERNLQAVASMIETMVERYPSQWYCFYPFFDGSARNDD